MITDTEATKRHAKRQGKQVTIDFVLIDDDEKPQEVVRILDGDPVRKLLNRGTITQEQFEAAEMLYSDWYIGGMSPRVVKPIKMVQVDEGSPELNESEMREFCQDRCFKAMKFVNPTDVRNLVEEVVLYGKSISDATRYLIPEFKKGNKVPKLVMVRMTERLFLGLESLSEFYEIT